MDFDKNNETAGQQQPDQQAPVAQAADSPRLTVCDVTGDWAWYQWNLTIFSVLYGTLCGLFATIGPLWTLDLDFRCAHGGALLANQSRPPAVQLLAAQPDQCKSLDAAGKPTECTSFLYDDQSRGLILTNSVSMSLLPNRDSRDVLSVAMLSCRLLQEASSSHNNNNGRRRGSSPLAIRLAFMPPLFTFRSRRSNWISRADLRQAD